MKCSRELADERLLSRGLNPAALGSEPPESEESGWCPGPESNERPRRLVLEHCQDHRSLIVSPKRPLAGRHLLRQHLHGYVPAQLGVRRPPHHSHATWPSVFFTFEGEGGSSVELEVKPGTYWQLNCTPNRQSSLNIGQSGMPQSILGLPLMNN